MDRVLALEFNPKFSMVGILVNRERALSAPATEFLHGLRRLTARAAKRRHRRSNMEPTTKKYGR
jgi:hypothetical protein